MRLPWIFSPQIAITIIAAVCLQSCADAQNIEGQPIASQYSTWQVSGFAPDTYNFVPTSCRVQGGASFFAAFAVGTPVKIVDGNPSLTEIVTPTNVVINNTTCSIAIAPANHHNLPFYLTSATGGLQEAINANVANPASNTIILDNKFYRSVGPSNVAAVIAAASGYTTLGLVDITQTPYVWYQWNGSQYVKSSVGGNVTSVFGRTGAVAAQTGDYDCAQVTGCLDSAPVTSVFTRTGAITAQSGDYTCLEVTGCGAEPNTYLSTTLSTSISTSDTVIPLSASPANLTTAGVVVIDSEWIAYSGISGNNLTGATRGYHQTTAATHASGAVVTAVIVDFTNPNSAPNSYIVPSGLGSGQTAVFNCPTPDTLGGAQIFMQFGCDDVGVQINDGGGIDQLNGSAANKFAGETGIGPGGGTAFITNSGYLFDSTRQNQSTVPQGFGAGLAGPVESVQPTSIGAPTITNFAQPAGSTTWSYECTGTDVDGNTYPGTVASIADGPTTITGGEIIVQCPFSAGAASETIWRTAGGANQGAMITTAGPDPAVLNDGGGSGTSGTPPATNNSIPKICTAGEQFCELGAATSTPTVACTAGTKGWVFHNVSATTSPFAYVCNGSSWVTAY